MLYIVGGLPRTGKTFIGHLLVQQTGAFALDTDDLRALFKAQPELSISFDEKNSAEQSTKALVPYIDAFIEFCFEEKTNQVICGEALLPSAMARYKEKSKICFLGLSDPKKQFARIRQNQHPNDWTRSISDEKLQALLQEFLVRSKNLQAACRQYNIPYVDVSSDDFLNSMASALQLLTGTRPTSTYLAKEIKKYMAG